MNTLEQLTLEAFQMALDRLEDPLPADLEQRIQAVSENWEAHISDLRHLAAQFEPLKVQYQKAREELQSESATRKQFLDNGFTTQPIPQTTQNILELDRPQILLPITTPPIPEPNQNIPKPQPQFQPPVTTPPTSEPNQNTPKPQPQFQRPPLDAERHTYQPDESPPPAPPNPWENFDRIAIMAAGGAFLGATLVQFLGGGPTQLIGALIGALIGILSGIYVS
jgi:hypothetical protein